MQDARAPVAAASKRSLTATAALLCFLSAPVLAATGLDLICDQSAGDVDQHAIDDLSIEKIEHSLTSRITSENDLGSGAEAEQEILPVAARQQEILRRIFDEPVTNVADEPLPNSETSEEIDAPLIEERSADVADSDLTDQESGDSLMPGIRLPSATPEETLRYRRQMFRTDI